MKLEYVATIDDVATAQLRHYLQGRVFPTQRLRQSFVLAMLAAGIYFVARFRSESPKFWLACAVIFVVAFTWKFLRFRSQVKGRLLDYLKKEKGHQLPAPVIYEITESQFLCNFLGVDLAFPLDSLTGVKEDAGYLEIWFGDAGLCTVPLRAFRDDAHKAEFVSGVKREVPA